MPTVSYNACDFPQVTPSKPAKRNHWAFVTIFQLVYSLVNAGMALYVLPLEAERLNGNGSLWVGIYLAMCGLTQVACPVVGKISDRHCSKYGRRRPFIVMGTVVAVLSFAVMRMASMALWPRVYLFFLFLGEMALNIAYSAHCGLPADLQGIEPGSGKARTFEADDHDTQGIVSGYLSLYTFIGALLAMAAVGLTQGMPVHVQYPIYMVSISAACAIVCAAVSEASTVHLYEVSREHLSLKDLTASFCLDMTAEIDFFWVCASRMFFYMSISSSVFMYYYLRDMIFRGQDADSLRSHLSTLVIVSQLVGAVCSIPCGHLSNRIGRKVAIYAANFLMSITCMLYAIAPNSGVFAWPVVVAGGLLYGMGAATYFSVDYALALECLPIGKTTAEAFGLWGVAGFLGSTIGPLVAGVLLWLPSMKVNWQGAAVDEYPYIGYVMVLILTGPIMNCIGAVLVSKIQDLKEDQQ